MRQITKENKSLDDRKAALSQRELDVRERAIAVQEKQAKGELGNDYQTINDKLVTSKGSDGYVNTDTYKALRSFSSDTTTFDQNFSWMLNPDDPSANNILSTTTKKSMTAAQINQSLGLSGYTQLTNDDATLLNSLRYGSETFAPATTLEEFIAGARAGGVTATDATLMRLWAAGE